MTRIYAKHCNNGPRLSCRLIVIIAALNFTNGCSINPIAARQEDGLRLTHQIEKLLGSPYRFGGNNPSGFDCSGLMQYTHQELGINIPRTTVEQLKHSRRVNFSNIRPGDLIFFHLNQTKASHVGMYIGKMQMIHAPSTSKHVSYADLKNNYWRSRIIAVGRYY